MKLTRGLYREIWMIFVLILPMIPNLTENWYMIGQNIRESPEVEFERQKRHKEKWEGINRFKNKGKIGDTVVLGSFNGKPIEWLLMDKNDKELILLSKEGLIARKFHETADIITWEKSNLRAWLNDHFYTTITFCN